MIETTWEFIQYYICCIQPEKKPVEKPDKTIVIKFDEEGELCKYFYRNDVFLFSNPVLFHKVRE